MTWKLHEIQISVSISEVLLVHSFSLISVSMAEHLLLLLYLILYIIIFLILTNKKFVEIFLRCYINTYIISSILLRTTRPKIFTI